MKVAAASPSLPSPPQTAADGAGGAWPGTPWQRVWLIAAVYAVVATLWIIFSDRVLLSLAPSPDAFSRWSVYKGVGFVIVTTALLVWLIARAFTALARAHAQLHQLNESLERKVAERTQALAEAAERAEAADRIKSAFLATMSHELRTPLNSIIGFTGIVLQGLAGPLTPEQTKQLGMVRGSARHLLELINDVLDLSKIEAGQLALSRDTVDIAASIRQCLGVVEPLAARKALTVQAQLPPDLGHTVTDRRRFEQVLLNLLNNAIKFTDHGHVTLCAQRVPAGASALADPGRATLQLHVTDTGIGIKPDDLHQLFLPFHQVDSGLARQHEGTGLGLAICRRLTDLMGGTIQARSQWGQGSTFTVVLPLETS